ncbi:hypothetical protein NEUTE2DRAFT_69842, partial [Neurospora tetrasperma FGSC 2509]
ILRVLKRRNFAGRNGIYDIKYYQLNRPSLLVGVRAYKFLVRVGKLTHKKGTATAYFRPPNGFI